MKRYSIQINSGSYKQLKITKRFTGISFTQLVNAIIEREKEWLNSPQKISQYFRRKGK